MRALALFSGGLDSVLAVKLVMEQGIEVIGIHFDNGFSSESIKRSLGLGEGIDFVKDAAFEVGIELIEVDITDQFLEILLAPRYGYGKGANPCVDCRILMLKKAKEMMEELDASFVVTGEVIGQRPMSQRPSVMKLIEREAGLKGLIVRPLCAKLLPPSIPEKKGWVRRELFLDIRGRSRKRQMELAEHYGITKFTQPAGGCILTDPSFAKRFFDLIKHVKNPTALDIQLLYVGRHFRLSPSLKLVIGRNEKENRVLLRFRGTRPIFWPENRKGPVALLYGEPEREEIELAARIVARYSKSIKGYSKIVFEFEDITEVLEVTPLEPMEVDRFRI